MHAESSESFDTDRSGCGWLSKDFQQLVAEIENAQHSDAPVFDVLIVGSGYGGSVAATTFAGRTRLDADGKRVPVRVAVLERGKEYLPGAFPADASEVPGHIRITGNEEGLFDVRLGPEVNTVVANGLGGGSLINAGVMEKPSCSVFGARWPQALSNGTALDRAYVELQYALGAKLKTSAGTTVPNAYGETSVNGTTPPQKFAEIRKLAPGNFRGAQITVALDDTVTSGSVRLDRCIGCGDCATGCNFNAKISLDTNLLVNAYRQGAEIYTGATVLRIEPDNHGWKVHTVYTNASLRKRHGHPVPIRTRKLVLAAGALGSSEILLRSRSQKLKFSNALGHRCSTNGDMLVTDYATDKEVNTVSDETVKPSDRHIGPTITGMIDLRERTDGKPPLVIEEMSVPAGLRRVFTEVFTTANTFHELGKADLSWHRDRPGALPDNDIYTATDDRIERTALYAVMGDDTAGGRVEISAGNGIMCDSTARIRWPGISQQALFEAQVDAIADLSQATGGKVLPSPAWRLLPDALERYMPDHGPLVTVHPLGGCAMADNPINGVVNQYGQVYKPAAAAAGNGAGSPDASHDSATPTPSDGHDWPVYDGLVVLDGSIVPTALGINPALTIAALARRAAKHLAGPEGWDYARDFRRKKQATPVQRPSMRDRDTLDQEASPTSTQVRLTERLSGRISLKVPGRRRQLYVVDLTLRFKPEALAHLMDPKGKPTVHLDGDQTDPYTDSRIRIFDIVKWNELNPRTPTETMTHGWRQLRSKRADSVDDPSAQPGATKGMSPREREIRLDRAALYNAPLAGTLTMFRRKRTSGAGRLVRGGGAWLLNRGVRDIWQGFRDREKGPRLRDHDWQLLKRRLIDGPVAIGRGIVDLARLATHAGEVRLEEYELEIGDNQNRGPDLPADKDGKRRILAVKEFTYSRRCNPWMQLMNVRVDAFPGAPGTISRGWRRILQPVARIMSRPRGLAGLPGRQLLVRMQKPNFSLDMDFLADIGVPMYEVTEQDNAVHGLAEFGSYAAWFIRMLAGIHLWTFRAPDRDKRLAPPSRLPGRLTFRRRKNSLGSGRKSDKLNPDVHEIEVATERPHFEKDAEPCAALVRLTRYARPESQLPPLVMIHGYSASGTSFSHPQIDPNFATYFYGKGRDVWIVDMRTSAGMPTANRGWSFEQVAFTDIPAALCYVYQQTERKVDVIAHCMGAAMFSMAVLQDGACEVGRDYCTEREKLETIINKAVLSQVGPLVVFSPANRFRGLLARFMTEFLPDRYTFNPGPEATLADNFLDRILASVPYPEREFDVENPPIWRFLQRTPWVRTRHRMDALYGRAFNADQVDPRLLRSIDDLFGPLSIQTVSQTIHFASLGMITDVNGRNTFVSRDNIARHWTFDTLGIHGVENGLSDISTQGVMEKILTEAGAPYRSERIENAGHQDCLIGASRVQVMDKIEAFLRGERPVHTASEQLLQKAYKRTVCDDRSADVPWVGPIVTRHFSDARNSASQRSEMLTIRIGAAPYHRPPAGVALLPVKVDGNRVLDENGNRYTREQIRRRMWLYQSTALRRTGWDSFVLPPELTSKPDIALLVLVIYPEGIDIAPFEQMANTTEDGELPAAATAPTTQTSVMKQWCVIGSKKDAETCADDTADATGGAKTLGLHHYLRAGDDGSVSLVRPVDWTPTESIDDRGHWDKASDYVFQRLHSMVADDDNAVSDRFAAADRSLLDGVVHCSSQGAAGAGKSERLSFALGSCQYQTSVLDAAPGYRSYRKLAQRLDATEPSAIVPQCLVLTGDQIYVDATRGLLDPSIKDDERYDKPYARWLRDHYVRTVLRQIPSFMMLDDHEIDDNWEPLERFSEADRIKDNPPLYHNGHGESVMALEPLGLMENGDDREVRTLNRRKLVQGRRAYLKYQYGALRPGLCATLGLTRDRGNAPRGLSYKFRVGGHPFFMLDTRTGRSLRRTSTISTAQLIAPSDMAMLKEWLTDPRNKDTGPKFIVSPAMILPRHKVTTRWQNAHWDDDLAALNSDGWDGYPATVKELLAFIHDEHIGQVVFLSGDEHRAIRAEADICADGEHTVRVNSIHTAPAYAPFTFANSFPEQFSDQTFSFDCNGKTYQCSVRIDFPDVREGFTVFRARREQGAWTLDCEFGEATATVPLGSEGTLGPPGTQLAGTLRMEQAPRQESDRRQPSNRDTDTPPAD